MPLNDFYEQNGVTVQPDIEGFATDGLLAPSFEEAAQTLDGLISYCNTRWYLDQAEADALSRIPKRSIVCHSQTACSDGQYTFFAVALWICENALGDLAVTWVRD